MTGLSAVAVDKASVLLLRRHHDLGKSGLAYRFRDSVRYHGRKMEADMVMGKDREFWIRGTSLA